MNHKKVRHFNTHKDSNRQLWIESIKKMTISHCLYPSCKNKDIIKSHALQNNGVISRLAVDNMVCMPRISRDSTVPLDSKFGLKLRKVGKNVATVFSGFCKKHDDQVFAPIEKKDWIPDKNSAFLFTYRTICSELHTKEEIVKRQDFIIDKEFNNFSTMPVRIKTDYKLECLAVSDLKRIKKQCDEYLERKRDIPISGINLRMPKANFAVSGFYIPYHDFNNRTINRVFGEVDFPFFINIIPCEYNTIVFLTAYKTDYNRIYKKYFNFIDNLSLKQKEIFLTNMAIKCSDNLVINPNSAEKLTTEQVQLIEGAANDADVFLEKITGNAQVILEDKGLNLFKI